MTMKLLSLTCPNCGANIEVNSELTMCTCNFCGKQFLVDDAVSAYPVKCICFLCQIHDHTASDMVYPQYSIHGILTSKIAKN